MAVWQKPVFDRTQADVEDAKRQLSYWQKEGDMVTAANLALKGCLNAFDLNRIEGNTAYLLDMLSQMGYPTEAVLRTDWSYADLPRVQDVARILQNAEVVLGIFYSADDMPPLPQGMNDHASVNLLEKALSEGYSRITSVRAAYRKSGTFALAQGRGLPLLREPVDSGESRFKKAGSFVSGQAIMLPVAREKRENQTSFYHKIGTIRAGQGIFLPIRR